MKMDHESKKIKGLGMVEGYKGEIENVRDLLESLPLWHPAVALQKECREVLHRMAGLKERFERKLVVTIIGPGGSGKSTLMNALAGADNISDAGSRRPTTESVVLLCKDPQEAHDMKLALGEENIQIRVQPSDRSLDNFILIDTPDTDSTAQQRHIPMVQRAVKASDVLLCVFNAENPKTRDHVDFFSAYIPFFHGGSLIGILNKCDRIDEHELRHAILPEFESYIERAWEQPLQSLFCISARRHLVQPKWDPNTEPRHSFDQFDELKEMVSQNFNRPGYGVDRRIENARNLRDFMLKEVKTVVGKHRDKLLEARLRGAEAEQSGLKEAFSAIREEGSGQGFGVNVLLYQRLANRWVGPVGWMIAIWARILIFGTGLMAIFRFGNPVRQVLGILSSIRHFKDAQANIADAEKSEHVGAALRGYRRSIMKKWPDIAERLVQGGFETGVRRLAYAMPQKKEVDVAIMEMWRESLDCTLDRTSRVFSNFMLQIIFNLPTLGILAHIGWLTARHYFTGDYLSSVFFLHAFLTAGIILFLSFFLFQGCVRLISGPENLVRKAFKRVQDQIVPFQQLSRHPVFEQLDIILELEIPVIGVKYRP